MFGRSLWVRKNRLAAPARYYGDGGTIHDDGHVSVEVHDGRVVAVWFRCQQLPFRQHDVNAARTAEMDATHAETLRLTGVELLDATAT